MAAADTKVVDLSPADHDRVERLLADFDRDWSAGQFVAVLEQLPPAGHPLRASALLGLVRVEIERQWQNGGEARLEDYLERCPELGTLDTVSVSLILQEFRARQRYGTAPNLDEYARRFPRQADELRRLVDDSLRESKSDSRSESSTEQSPAFARRLVDDSLRESKSDSRSESSTEQSPAAAPALAVPAKVVSPRISSPALLSPSAPNSSSSIGGPKETDGPTLPEQFDRYRIIKKLGHGGMGAVYLAHDTKLDRRVALKVPKFSPDSDPENLERFYREARATATIHHPNLCPLHDVGEFNGIPYLTMAYIEGWPLSHFVRPDKRLPQAGTAALVRTVALAIAEAHKLGIIHRDLKPGNILVDKRGQPIVMDFGLARWVNADKDDVRLTKSGSILGAPIYMSPEQVYGDVENMGPSCDVYSLGVILYELLTGRLPFEGNTTAVLAKTLMQTPTPPSKHRPDLDPRLEAICLKAMAKQINERFATMTEMAAALADFIKAEKQEREGTGSGSRLPRTGKLKTSPSGSGITRPSEPAPAVVAPRSDESGSHSSFPIDPPSGEQRLRADRPTPSLSNRETVSQATPSDVKKRSPKAVIPTDADDTSALADPSVSFVRRVSPKPPPKMRSIRQSRKKLWLIGGGILLLLAGGGLLTWFLWPEPPATTVKIRLNPPNAQVRVEIDESILDMNVLADPYKLKPGTHTLVVTGKGFEDFRLEFNVNAEQERFLDVQLKPLAVVKADPVEPVPPVGPPAKLDAPFDGHNKRPVRCVAFSGDGKKVVSGGDDGRLIAWNMVTHKMVFAIEVSKQPILAVALDEKGIRAATTGTDGVVRVWDLTSKTLKPIGEIPNGSATMAAVTLSADGKLVLFGGEDKVVRLWEVDNKAAAAVKTFNGHSGAVCAVAFAPNGKHLASAGEDQTIRIWDPNNTARETKKLTGHTDTVRSIAYTRDGKRLVSGGDDRILRLWDVDNKATVELKRFAGHSGTIRSVSFTLDDKGIVSAATGPFDNTLRYWNADTGAFIRIVGRHKDGVYAVACSRLENNRALSGGEDGVLRLWDLAATSAGSPMPTLDALVEVRRLRAPDGAKTGLNRVAVARDGRRLLTAGKDGVGRIWDAATGKEILALKETSEALHFVDFSADGKLALTGGADKKVRVWNAETGDLLRTFDGHKERVLCGVFTPDGQHVVTAGDGAVALLWKVKDGTIVQRFEKHHTKPINGVALAPDGKRLLTASDDGNLCLWEVNAEKSGAGLFVRSIPTEQGAVTSVAFLPDGKRAVTGGHDRSVRLWSLDGGKLEHRFDGHLGQVSAVAVSPGGRLLLSAGADGTVVLWDLLSGKLLTRYTGHAGTVGGVSFTPDGSQAVSAGADRTLRLLDLPRSHCDPGPLPNNLVNIPSARPFTPTHGDVIESVVVTPDSKRGLSASWDKTVRLWDLTDGKELAVFALQPNKVHAVAVSHDGKRALSAGYDHQVLLWDLEKLKPPIPAEVQPLKVLKGHTKEVQSVAFAPNGKRAVSGGSDNVVIIWDVDKGTELKRCTGHAAPIWAVTFLPDNKHILSASRDKTIRRWDADTGKEAGGKWLAPDEIHALAIAPDGRRAVSGGKDKLVHLWDVATGQLLASFHGHTNTIAGIAFAPDGRWVLSGSDDNTARLWDVETGREVGSFTGSTMPILGVAFAPDGKTALLGGRDKIVRQWTLPEFTAVLPALPLHLLDTPLERLALSPDGRFALLAGVDGARLWDLKADKEVHVLKGHGKPVRSAAFAPDSQRACTTGDDGTIRVWSVVTGEELFKINGHAGKPVWSAVFSPDGSTILSSGDDKLANLWIAETGAHVLKFTGHTAPVTAVAFTPDGRTVLTASDRTLRALDAATSNLMRSFDGTAPITAMAVSADGRFVLAGSQDKKLRLWLLETGESLHEFAGPGTIESVALSPDGRYGLSAGDDKTVRLWDVRYGKALTTFFGHKEAVTGVGFGNDGRHIASVSKDKTFRWWNLPPR